jgi:RHS repeat-associated protein
MATALTGRRQRPRPRTRPQVCPRRWGGGGQKPYNRRFCGVISGYRYYNPAQGRFLTREPLGEEGGINLYAFCNNDPINNFDYLGLLTTSVIYTNADVLDVDWAGATTSSRISKKVDKEPCDCGNKISNASVDVKSTVTIKTGLHWSDLSVHGLTILQHENQHVKIDQGAGKKIEDDLKKLIGKCRDKKCMEATDNYIAAMVNYYGAEEDYKNAKFDVLEYPPGKPQDIRRRGSEAFRKTMEINKKVMDDASKTMKDACDK